MSLGDGFRVFPRGGSRTENPGSTLAPEAEMLWDEIPTACEARKCRACGLAFLVGPGQVNHWQHCPENANAIQERGSS